MTIHVDIEDKQVENFSKDAKECLEAQMKKYVEYVIKEINLIEEGSRENGANSEITSTIVLQALNKYKNLPRKGKKKKVPTVVIKVVSTVAFFIAGCLFDFDAFQTNADRLMQFLIAFIIASIVTALQFMEEE